MVGADIVKKDEIETLDLMVDILKGLNWNMTARTNKAKTKSTIIFEKVSR